MTARTEDAEDNRQKTEIKEAVKEAVEEAGQPVPVRREPEKVLLEWDAPVRSYKKRSRQFWTTAFTMAFLVGMIMFFVEGWMPVAVIIAFIFLVYVMSSVPPEEVHLQVTTRGLKIGESRYLWEEMVQFWFSEKWGQSLVNVVITRLPWRLVFLLGSVKKEELKGIFVKYLPYEEVKPTWIDRASTWLGKKLPLETE
jgi:hypothetical protein